MFNIFKQDVKVGDKVKLSLITGKEPEGTVLEIGDNFVLLEFDDKTKSRYFDKLIGGWELLHQPTPTVQLSQTAAAKETETPFTIKGVAKRKTERGTYFSLLIERKYFFHGETGIVNIFGGEAFEMLEAAGLTAQPLTNSKGERLSPEWCKDTNILTSLAGVCQGYKLIRFPLIINGEKKMVMGFQLPIESFAEAVIRLASPPSYIKTR